MAMMPTTQIYVNQELQRRQNAQLLKTMQEDRKRLRRRLYMLEQSCSELSRQIVPPLEQERRQFHQSCGQAECKGFLSTGWKCNICHRYTCSECNAPRGLERDDDHVCNEEEKRTMQLIKHDSKKCPGCAQYIFKVSGCDQMWCTACHTAFSWKTGLKINGVIHNPHFYEFQRGSNALDRELNDIPCGGLPTIRELSEAIRRSHLSPSNAETLTNMHRLTLHVEHVELLHWQPGNIEANNLDLRIGYMLNEVSDVVLKQKIQQREKKMQKKNDIFLILQMFHASMADFLRQLVLDGQVVAHMQDMRALALYANKSFMNVSFKYSCVVPFLDIEKNRILSRKM